MYFKCTWKNISQVCFNFHTRNNCVNENVETRLATINSGIIYSKPHKFEYKSNLRDRGSTFSFYLSYRELIFTEPNVLVSPSQEDRNQLFIVAQVR